MSLPCGMVRTRFVIFGDKSVRVGTTAQPSPPVNLNEVSLGQRGSRADRIPRKEIVSGDTAAFPTNSSTTRAAYFLNRSHSSVVGVLVIC